MLYFLYGTDRDKAREKAQGLLVSLQQKKPDALVFRLDPERWGEVHLEELIGGQGLFEQKILIFADRLFENEEAESVIEKNLRQIGESDNIFIFLEQEVRKALLLAIAESAEKIQEFSGKGKNEKPAFNIFSLTDALGRRDKKNLWMLYQKALREDFAPEHINSVLFWKVKSLLTASYSSRSWSREELKDLSRRLVSLYHDAHRGIHDFAIGLERLVLTL